MSHLFTFLSAWITSPAKVGAIAPSSAALARRMVDGLRLDADEAIVEFGPGTGPFTRKIRQVIPGPDRYLGIERDEAFVKLLHEQFPDLNVRHASAQEARRLVREAGLRRVRAILCGLPFASLPDRVQDDVIEAIDGLLEPGGEFRTFQYVHAYVLPQAIRYRHRMAQVFGPHHRSRAVLWNLPPAYVLTWKRTPNGSESRRHA